MIAPILAAYATVGILLGLALLVDHLLTGAWNEGDNLVTVLVTFVVLMGIWPILLYGYVRDERR